MTDKTLTQYFTEDHKEIDSLFQSIQEEKNNLTDKKELFKRLKHRLQRHIVWEEDILFSLFEKHTGLSNGGPTAVMRMEHRQIGNALEKIHTKLKKDDINTANEEHELTSLLSQHNLKEERILYPAIDKVIRDDELENIYKAMAEIPEERYKQCCLN